MDSKQTTKQEKASLTARTAHNKFKAALADLRSAAAGPERDQVQAAALRLAEASRELREARSASAGYVFYDFEVVPDEEESAVSR